MLSFLMACDDSCLTFADEANVVASTKVYSLLGADDKIRLIHRPGDHHGFDDVNTYLPQEMHTMYIRMHTICIYDAHNIYECIYECI